MVSVWLGPIPGHDMSMWCVLIAQWSINSWAGARMRSLPGVDLRVGHSLESSQKGGSVWVPRQARTCKRKVQIKYIGDEVSEVQPWRRQHSEDSVCSRCAARDVRSAERQATPPSRRVGLAFTPF